MFLLGFFLGFCIIKIRLKDFIMELKEILTTAGVCFAMTLFGLSLGFGLLKIQGD